MSWYERSFGERYLRLYAHRDREEARRAVNTLFPGHSLAGRRVLDLACGPGRYLRVLYERGARAVGVDLSPVLLAEARRVFSALPATPALVRADMRRLPFGDRSFDSTLSMFTSFGYFDRDEEHAALAREMARVTAAVIVVDVPDPVSLQRSLVPRSQRRLEDMRVIEERWIQPEPLRVCKRLRLVDPETGTETESYEERVRLYRLEELQAFFSAAGFGLEDVLGDYEGAQYEPGRTERMILRLRREHR